MPINTETQSFPISNGMKKYLALAAALPSLGIILIVGFLYFHDRTQNIQIEKIAPNNTSSTSMLLTSPSFKHNEFIPAKFTCDGFDTFDRLSAGKLTTSGGDMNPELVIANVPAEAKSLALIMDDPDAPGGTFTHWTVWNIDPLAQFIKEESTPPKSIEGITDFGRIGYGGPCPPSGTHHYHFKLYALDATLDLPEDASRSNLEKEIQKHLIEQTELVGLYGRQN